MVNLILSKYVITNQIAQTADVCKVVYVTLPILYLFYGRSNLVPYAFVWEKVKTMDFQKLFKSMISKLVDAVN